VGSPITFSGFNSIDFNMILSAVMAQERRPLDALTTQKQTLETQNTALSTLAGKLSTLDAAADALKAKSSLAVLKASSSDTGVGASAGTGTVAGTYEVAVTKLAKSQVSASSTTYSSSSAVVGTGGTLTLTPSDPDDDPVTITLTATTTLAELADLINAEDGSPATASVVQSATGVYKLVLTGKETGASNAFTLTPSGGSGLTFGVNPQDAIDAELTVNSLLVTSASNTVTDVIPGVTLTLAEETTATISVTKDTDKTKELVNKFISAYNDVIKFIADQNTAAVAGRVSIARDPLLRSFRDAMRGAMFTNHTEGSYEQLATVGIGFDRDGKMTLDTEAFNSAMSTNPADVQLLFSGSDGTGGAFGTFSSVLEDYTKAGGFLPTLRTRNEDRVSSINKRLDTMEVALEIRRQALQKEYIAADLAMTQLKNQGGSLSSLASQYKLY
jgi:flagellar hook-associated protein 2